MADKKISKFKNIEKTVENSASAILLIVSGILSAIVLILMIIGTGWFVYKKLAQKPDYSFTVRFIETPPVHEDWIRRGISVYYRGIKVGKVSQIKFAEDQKSLLYNVQIFKKGLKLPKNTFVVLQPEDFIGNLYIDLNYPEKPLKELIENGDIVKGKAPMTVENLNLFLEGVLEEGEIEKLIKNVNKLSTIISERDLKDLEPIINNIKRILNNKEFMEELVYTPKSLRLTSQELNVTTGQIKKINNNMNNLQGQIDETKGILNKTNSLVYDTEALLGKTNNNLVKTDNNIELTNSKLNRTLNHLDTMNPQLCLTNKNLCEINGKVTPELTQNADKLLKKADDYTQKIDKAVEKKFFIPRLIFGSPSDLYKN